MNRGNSRGLTKLNEMKSFIPILIGLFFSVQSFAQETYKIGNTEYYVNERYSTSGKPMVKRSETNKTKFLRSHGYSSTPAGYEIDHIIPLSKGGTDDPSNMQLLTIEEHARKTARERANRSVSTYSQPQKYNSTISYYSKPSRNSSGKTTYTGKNGGTYYINSNGNKTYIKKNENYSIPSKTYSTPYNAGRTIHTGSRGGQYYINGNGNKTYIKK